MRKRGTRVFAPLALAMGMLVSSVPSVAQAAPPAAALLGTGRGVDHVVIAVRDLDLVANAYAESLGFNVSPGGSLPGGIRNRAVRFANSYLELLSVDSAHAATNQDLAPFLKEREGIHALALNVSSAQATADFLRSRGFEVTGPEGASFAPEGSADTLTNAWQTLFATQPMLPPGPIFFIEYARRSRSEPPVHPNTAVLLHAGWLAVRNLEAAARTYAKAGLRAGRSLKLPRLAARGREIEAGEGALLLVQANGTRGPIAQWVAQHGEGIVGVSVEVRDLRAARALLAPRIHQALMPYNGPHGWSILVPPEFTHGLWLELFEKR